MLLGGAGGKESIGGGDEITEAALVLEMNGTTTEDPFLLLCIITATSLC